MLDLQKLTALRQTEISNVDKNQLVEISTVSVDASLPGVERMQNYLEQVKNPYCFRSGDITVRVRFEPDGPDLDNLLKNYFIGKKKDG